MTDAVLVLGARGRFGLAACQAFANAGWRVLAQVRPGTRLPLQLRSDARLHWIQADLMDASGLARAAQGASVIVHALNPLYTHKAWKAQVPAMTRASIALARALNATVMLPGNIYNFGVDMPAVLREDTPQIATTVKGRIRIDMERTFQTSGVQTVVIRAGDFFGAGRGSWLDQAIVKDIAKGVLTYPGSLKVATAWAYLPDLARTFVAVAARRQELDRFTVFHFKGYSVTGQEWLDASNLIAASQDWIMAGGTLKYKKLPWSMIRALSWLMPTWAALLEMRYLWETPHNLANDRLVGFLGAEPHTPLDAALLATMCDLGLVSREVTQGKLLRKPAPRGCRMNR